MNYPTHDKRQPAQVDQEDAFAPQEVRIITLVAAAIVNLGKTDAFGSTISLAKSFESYINGD